ncbi:MAG: hypothetical protein ACE5I1_26580 [bacterium]
MNNRRILALLTDVLFVFGISAHAHTQELKLKNATSWELQGRVQLQNLINTDIEGNGSKTNNGFMLRRGRIQVSGRLTEFVKPNFK